MEDDMRLPIIEARKEDIISIAHYIVELINDDNASKRVAELEDLLLDLSDAVESLDELNSASPSQS